MSSCQKLESQWVASCLTKIRESYKRFLGVSMHFLPFLIIKNVRIVFINY